jgi:hypothetical protein
MAFANINNDPKQDARSAYLHNEMARRVNEARQHRATFGNADWVLSQGPEFFKNEENRVKYKPTLVSQKANQDFWTTDRGDTRNMYQMVLNNMVRGSGARMLDLRGLPSVVQADPNKYRRGRKMFQDPSKSQGFFGDVGSLFTGNNRAAVYAHEYNPLHEEGYGRDWFIDRFGKPWGETLDGIMKLALPGPLKFMRGKEREPLPSDRSWIPEGLGEYDELPMIDFDASLYKDGIAKLVPDDIKNQEIASLNEIANSGEGIFYGGRGELSPDFDYEEDREGRELSRKIAFLESINPHIDYDDVMPGLIDELYEKALRDSDTTSEINTANTQDEMKDLKKQIMSNTVDEGLDPTKFGDISQLYDIDANVFDPEGYITEQTEKGIMPNMVTGIDESKIPAINEQQIINEAVEKNPWIMRIMGKDYKYIRGWLWDIGVLNPNSDMYKKTSQLEIPE